jgi:hypothetical protein
MQKTLGHIKLFLKAKKPEILQDLMLQNNIKTSCYHDYRIMNVDGFWYAWYEMDANALIEEKFRNVDSNKRQ